MTLRVPAPQNPTPRRGTSLVEVLTVMAILVLFGALAIPTLREFNSNSRIKAAADTLKGRIADARAAAMETGRSYRLALNPEGTQLRLAPDDAMFQDMATTSEDDVTIVIGETALPKEVTASLMTADEAASMDDNGWTRIATFRPDGTCREDNVTIRLNETGQIPLLIIIRGLTGAATIVKDPNASPPNRGMGTVQP